MHYLSCVLLHGFYVGALVGRCQDALVVYREKEVLDVNDMACKLGVRLDCSLPEARTLLRGSGQFLEWREEDYRSATKTWLDICAEYTDVIEPLDQHETLLDLAGHPDPENVCNRIFDDLEKAGFRSSIGSAGNRWIARLAARHPGSNSVALHAPRIFVSSMPVETLPIDAEISKSLLKLGYQRIGHVAKVDLNTLRTYFGDDAYEIKRFSLGGGSSQVAALYPPDCISTRLEFEGVLDSLDSFNSALWELSERLGNALQEKDLCGEELIVTLEHEQRTISKLQRKFSKPISSAKSIHNALSLLLTKLSPDEIIAVRVRIPNLKKVQRIQKELTGTTSTADRSGAVTKAVENVRQTFGAKSIKVGAEISEARWQKVRRIWRSANGWGWT